MAVTLVALLGCTANVDFVEGSSSSIVYGEDDRQEYFELADTLAGATLATSMVALIESELLSPGSADPTAGVPSYGTVSGLCATEAFAEQPAAAFCSGVLLDWDLVLTAGHCVRLISLSKMTIALGYYYEQPGKVAFDASDMFRPVEIVAEALDPPGAEPRLDYAWLRLDRPVMFPHRPALVHTRAPPVAEGQQIVSIGAPGGVPMKIDSGGRLRSSRQGFRDYFTADTDTSHGSSGGGAFDQDMALLGILSRGGTDLIESTEDGCYVTYRVPETLDAEEEFTYAHRAIEGLCQRDTGSALCRAECETPCELPSWPRSAEGGCSTVAVHPSRAVVWPAPLVAILALCSRRRRRTRQSLVSSDDHLIHRVITLRNRRSRAPQRRR